MNEILSSARQTLEIESNAIKGLIDRLDDEFEGAVKRIHESNGRVVISGIGKSANIANKIVATLNSTGTPAIFMHAADAIHGDLGNVQSDDVVICISNSGNTDEIKVLVPLVKSMGNTLVALTGNPDSYLGKEADFTLNSHVEKEACPNNLAPTSSTTAQLALGDALAVCLLEMKNFSEEDFAKYHPGGALGKMLATVGDLMHDEDKPEVAKDTPLSEVIIEISSKRLGACAVIDNGSVVGIITDGDLRRMLEKGMSLEGIVAEDIMSRDPKTITPEVLAKRALAFMESNSITQLLVANDGKYLGVVHMHDILKQGID